LLGQITFLNFQPLVCPVGDKYLPSKVEILAHVGDTESDGGNGANTNGKISKYQPLF